MPDKIKTPNTAALSDGFPQAFPRRNRAAARNPARFEFDPARSTAARLSDVVRTLNAGGFGTQHPSHALPLQTAQRFCRVWPHGQGWLSLSKNSIEFGYLVFR